LINKVPPPRFRPGPGAPCPPFYATVYNLGSFGITELEPIKRGAVWFISFKSLKNDKCQSCHKRSNQKALQFWRVWTA